MSSPRFRNAIASVLGVLAVLLLAVGTVAVWTRTTVSDSERVGELVGDALAEPDVAAALAAYVTDQVLEAIDIEARLTGLLPDALARLPPVLVGGVRTAVDRGLTAALSDPRVQEVLTDLVVRTHASAMRLLQGDGLMDGVAVVDGTITINLLPLIGRGLGVVQQLGLLDDVGLPELTAEGDPAVQISQLEAALGRDLADDFGQLAVYQSDTIASSQASVQRAQDTVAFARRAIWLVLVAAVVLAAASIGVAVDRWRAIMFAGLGVVVAMVLIRAAMERVVDDAPELANGPGGRAAIDAIVSGASTSLLRLATAVLVAAALVVAWAMARSGWRRNVVLVAAVVAGLLVVSLLGLSTASLIAAIAVTVLVAVATPVSWRRT